MKQNTAWNWEKVNQTEWLTPAPEMYYLLHRWQKLGFNKFLDLGCGVGRHTVFFAQHGFECYACDLSSSAIAETSKNLKEKQLVANLKALNMHDVKNNYEPNSFDCILTYRVINHTNTLKFNKLLKDIISLLKPNGEAYIVVDSYNENFLKSKNYEFIEPLSAIKKGGIEDGVLHHFATPNEFINIENTSIIMMYDVLDYKIDANEFNPYKLYVLIKKIS